MSTSAARTARHNHPHRRTAHALRVHEDPVVPSEASSSVRRRKSRSSERTGPALAQIVVPKLQADTSRHGSKKKRPLPSSSSRLVEAVEIPVDDNRGRPIKPRPKARYRVPLSENGERTSQAPLKREGSKSRDPHHLAKKHASSEMGVLESNSDAHSEIMPEVSRLKQEIEVLKKQLHDSKKMVKKHNKTIEEMKADALTKAKAMKTNELAVQKYKTKLKKSEEVVSNIEGNMQCLICMELLFKPFALAPCGHVLCLGCLQEWFRKAPPVDDDMFDEDDPDYLLHRRKTCPCCRASVFSRPAPVFVVKAVATTLSKHKPPAQGTPPRVSPPPDADPWDGLFPPVDAYGYPMDADSDEEDYGEGSDDDDDDDMGLFAYGTDSDEDSYDGVYYPAQWAPASLELDGEDLVYGELTDSDISLLRRGATLEMLDTYDMYYQHQLGVVLSLSDGNRLFLGWNINLRADDPSGDAFVEWALADMEERPERWAIQEHEDGTWDAKRLLREDEVEEYDTTDTEAYDVDDLDLFE